MDTLTGDGLRYYCAMNATRQSKRPLFQFSLRGLLLLLVLAGGLLGWKMASVHRQRRAVEWIESVGGSVRYDFEGPGAAASPHGASGFSGWAQDVLGDDFFGHIVSVSLSGCRDVDDISLLSGLPKLRSLDLSGTQVSDLAPLRDLTELTSLELHGAAVRDASPLAGLTRLETLTLENTQVADIAPLAGLTRLKGLSLAGTPVSDLSPLAGMSELIEFKAFYTNVRSAAPLANLAKLEYLDLSDSQVEDANALSGNESLRYLSLSRTRADPEEVQQLRSALPKCRIGFRQ